MAYGPKSMLHKSAFYALHTFCTSNKCKFKVNSHSKIEFSQPGSDEFRSPYGLSFEQAKSLEQSLNLDFSPWLNPCNETIERALEDKFSKLVLCQSSLQYSEMLFKINLISYFCWDKTMPINSMPINSMPTNSMPTNSMPINSMPINSMPNNSMRINSMPNNSMPT